jgi:O-antigen/teichoic acid export membrane protein
MPNLRHGLVLKAVLAFPVLKFGGWMTVSNLVAPLMNNLDRFLIGTLLSVSAVAYYTAPFDMASRITILPTSIMGVLFPAIALNLATDSSRARWLVSRGTKYTFLAVFPIVLTIVSMAPELLRFWLGNAFAENSTASLRCLSLGVLLNSLAYVPFTLIQSAGRPDITAKVHLLELPLYLFGLYKLVQGYGITGAAMAWTGRVALDVVLLSFLAGRLLPKVPGSLMKQVSAVFFGVLLLYLVTVPGSVIVRLTFLAVVLLGFGLTVWFWAFDANEKTFLFSLRREASGERI